MSVQLNSRRELALPVSGHSSQRIEGFQARLTWEEVSGRES
jgi:hypothetical protein